MWNKICLRPASTRRLLIGLSLACWLVIFFVYFFLIKRQNVEPRVRAVTRPVDSATWETYPLAGISLRHGDVHVLLLSAYRDPRLAQSVRVIAAGRVNPLPSLFCQTALSSEHSPNTALPARVSSLLPKVDVRYDALFIDCPLPSTSTPPPRFVAVSTNASGPASFMRITDLPAAPPHSPTIGACVCPLHGDGAWVSARHMASWIEMNRLLGVQHFVFYNYSAPPSLRPLFRHYARLGVVELLQWRPHPLPVAEVGSWPPPQRLLHYFGQFVVFNECLYRMLHRFRYAMFADLDELLVPTQPFHTLPQLLTRLETNATYAFAFRGTYLRTDFPQESDHKDILFLRYGRRELRVLSHDVAPKLILKPSLVRTMGIHDVLTAVGETRQRVLEPTEALLMHYKTPPRYLRINDPGVRDERVLRFREQLIRRVESTLKRL